MQQFQTEVTNRRKTPQTEKVPGVQRQATNNAGGVSFTISKWDYLERFLVLGTEGGTFYVKQKALTVANAKNVQECIDSDGTRAVDAIVEVSQKGRSANNDAAVFALAMACSCKDKATRKYALGNLDKVCRIGTHLFHFMVYIKTMRGFGRGLREAIADWYTSKDIDTLAYQVLKYQQRDGWSHKDVLRMCHAIPVNGVQNALFSYIVGKRDKVPAVSSYAIGYEKIKSEDINAAKVITGHNLTREVIPTELLRKVSVWEALLVNMPMNALVRNLGKMASLNMHKPFSDSLKLTIEKLTSDTAIKRSRLHPLAIMNALLVYNNGAGIKGSLSWEPNGKVSDALEYAFYKSFENVEPTGKRIMLALDVSGSMTFDKIQGGMMDCREASAVLAMVTMRTEPETFVAGFTAVGSRGYGDSGTNSWNRGGISLLPLTAKQNLTGVLSKIDNLPFTRTDCSLPFQYCEHMGIDVDAIVVYTDSETYAGNIHPWQALDRYQDKVGHEVKSVVVGMVANDFSIARPDYTNMLDVVGFSTNTPSAISNFIR